MKYEFTLPGFEQQSLLLEVRFPLRPRILVNKKIINSTGKWNELALRRDDGLTSIVTISNQFPDPVPTLSMDEENYFVVSKLSIWNYIWALLPILLWIAILGVTEIKTIGIALIAAYLNFWILRFQLRALEKNLMIFAVNTGSAVIYFLVYSLMVTARLNG
jgi:hypothetical protein